MNGETQAFNAMLRQHVDEVICLETPDDFYAIGIYYDDFAQVSDDEVRRLLLEHRPKPAQFYGAKCM